jgi:transposase InsO family protein
MPWERRTEYQMRKEFVERVNNHEKSIARLCREYKISRRTGYKWLKRAEESESLADRSRRPITTQRIAPETEQLIVRYRQQYPALGAMKLHRLMMDEGYTKLPSVKTFNNVFKRNGLITREDSEKVTPYKRFEHNKPNDLWQGDFLGHFALGNGERCHTLNVLDDHSRFNLCSEPLHGESLDDVQPVLTRVFREYGMPTAFLCDNGNPWGNAQTTGFTSFEVWLMEHGILTIHGRPLHPQTQGKEERFNGTERRELVQKTTMEDWDDAKKKFDAYRQFYNEKRPHHALNLDVPAQHFSASDREWSDNVPQWEYPEGTEIRKVRGNGCFSWENQGYFLSGAFSGKEIAIRPSHIEDCISLFFRQFRIARIDVRKRVYTFKRIYLIDGDPRLTD